MRPGERPREERPVQKRVLSGLACGFPLAENRAIVVGPPRALGNVSLRPFDRRSARAKAGSSPPCSFSSGSDVFGFSQKRRAGRPNPRTAFGVSKHRWVCGC